MHTYRQAREAYSRRFNDANIRRCVGGLREPGQRRERFVEIGCPLRIGFCPLNTFRNCCRSKRPFAGAG
jgi:hypothetical protein